MGNRSAGPVGVALLLTLAACTTHSASLPNPSTSATAQPATTPRATLLEMTTVEAFRPWTASGILSPRFHVLGYLFGGSCFVAVGEKSVANASIADTSNEDAWRCVTPHGGIYDPCFAPPGISNVTKLACAVTPYLRRGVDLLQMAKPLPTSSTGFKPTEVSPLVLELSNGDRCEVIQGTGLIFRRVVLNYGCDHGYASVLRTVREPWTVSYLPTGVHALVRITVTTVWE